MKQLLQLCFLSLLSVAGLAQAADYTSGSLRISQPWARATAPGAASGGGFLSIDNKGPADRLVSASAGVANTVELHTMSMDGNVMRMAKLERGIEVPAGGKVELKPGSLHIMFIGLKAPLKEGDSFPLTLKFEKAGELSVNVKIGALGAAAPAGDSGMEQMKHTH